MRKIEHEMVQAIVDRRDWRKSNTEVEIYPDFAEIKLHGHAIAEYWFNKELIINHCGWQTVTTKSRLNAIIQFVVGGTARVFQKNFEWFYKAADGEVKSFDKPLTV